MYMFDSPDDKLMVFGSLFWGVLDDHAPHRTVRVKRKTVLWMTKHIRDEMDVCNKLLKCYRLSRSPSDWELYRLHGET